MALVAVDAGVRLWPRPLAISTARAPATADRTKAAAGPLCSTMPPAAAAPTAAPTATAPASQAKASVTVPAGAAA